MVRISGKSFWLGCPDFTDVFEGRETLESLQPPPIIVGIDEVVEVDGQLRVAVVMVAFDRRFLDRAVHPFDLAVGPWVLDLGEPVFDPVFLAAHVEHVGHVGCGRAVGVARRERELDAIIGQRLARVSCPAADFAYAVDFVWHGFDQRDQEG